MDQDVFTRQYFTALGAHAAKYGYQPRAVVSAVAQGATDMVENDGKKLNNDVFWAAFFKAFPDRDRSEEKIFDEFYETSFDGLKSVAQVNPDAKAVVERLAAKSGLRLVLASNPVFPRIAQERRVRWAGIEPSVFCHVTSYENSHYCKPNPAYFTEIAEVINARPDECLMIGNDAVEDGAAIAAGFKFFLLTDGLLHGDGFDLNAVPHGGYIELNAYLDELGL